MGRKCDPNEPLCTPMGAETDPNTIRTVPHAPRCVRHGTKYAAPNSDPCWVHLDHSCIPLDTDRQTRSHTDRPTSNSRTSLTECVHHALYTVSPVRTRTSQGDRTGSEYIFNGQRLGSIYTVMLGKSKYIRPLEVLSHRSRSSRRWQVQLPRTVQDHRHVGPGAAPQ